MCIVYSYTPHLHTKRIFQQISFYNTVHSSPVSLKEGSLEAFLPPYPSPPPLPLPHPHPYPHPPYSVHFPPKGTVSFNNNSSSQKGTLYTDSWCTDGNTVLRCDSDKKFTRSYFYVLKSAFLKIC